MIQSRRRFMKYLAKLFDLCVLITAFVSAGLVLSDGMTLTEFMGMRIKLSNFLLFGLLLILWHNLFIVCGLYTSKRLTTVWAAILEVCGATVLAGVVLAVLIKVFQIHLGTPKFVILFWVFCTAGMIGGRLVARSLLLALRSRGRNTKIHPHCGHKRSRNRFSPTDRETSGAWDTKLSDLWTTIGAESRNLKQPASSAAALFRVWPIFFGTLSSTKRQCICRCDLTMSTLPSSFPCVNSMGSRFGSIRKSSI